MNSERYEKLKSEVLPKSVLEYFNQIKETFEKNKRMLDDVGKPLEFGTKEENTLLKIVSDTAKRNEHALSVLFDNIELSVVSIKILQKKIKHLENTLVQQGADIDKVTKYDDLFSFIDGYLKHTPKEGDEKEDG